ncbi:MAG TPA: hypothetical protein VFO49_15615 [Nocardioides sp.]|nr:hypothetical protein [Nocardioides sp.]
MTGKQRRIALPSVAVNLPKGLKLFLVATAISDTFALMGARVPGVVLVDDTVVHLPVVGR